MDIFQFSWATLAWLTTIAVIFPANVPMAALAFRIWRENRDSDIEGGELWWRAVYAAFVLAAAMALFVGLDWLLADQAELPPGPIHVSIIIGYVALSAYLMTYFFSLNDYFEGLSLVVIYLFLPLLALFLVNALLGWINPTLGVWDRLVDLAKTWLVKPA